MQRKYPDELFVFGSNLDGAHAGGAARGAKLNYGAVEGVGEGPTGLSYALPTVGHNFARMTPLEIIPYVENFITFAKNQMAWAKKHKKKIQRFKVTRVGCGLAGLKDEDIAPMFFNAPENCFFDTEWTAYLPTTAKFWGTFAAPTPPARVSKPSAAFVAQPDGGVTVIY